jgi:probable rRNA maturation factor
VEVLVLNRQRAHTVRPARLERLLARLASAVPAAGCTTLGVSLVSPRRIRAYNRDFRGKDLATDVLAFPGGEPPVPGGERHLGDIVISVAQAAAQARRAGESLARELDRLAIHGYLHLVGYDHETDSGEMRRIERQLARRLLEPRRSRPT